MTSLYFLPLISQHTQNLSFSFTMKNLSETVFLKKISFFPWFSPPAHFGSVSSYALPFKKNYISNSLLPLHFHCCFYFIASHWTTHSNSSCGRESFWSTTLNITFLQKDLISSLLVTDSDPCSMPWPSNAVSVYLIEDRGNSFCLPVWSLLTRQHDSTISFTLMPVHATLRIFHCCAPPL